MIEEIIDALVTIGNSKKVIEICDPNTMQALELKAWMVKRSIKALELFEDEWKRLSENAGSGL